MLQRQKVNDYMLMDGTPSKLKQNEEKMESESVLKLRYIIAFIGFLMFLLLSIHRTVMSVAIVAMVNNTAVSHLTKAESCPNLITNISVADNFHQITKPEGDLPWPPHLQGYVLGSYFLGYVITQLPSGILAERFGYKWFLFSASMVTGVLTLLIPPASWFNASTVIAVQAMRGLAQGFVQPSIAILTSNWFPKQERGFLYSFMLSGTCLGTAVASIFTGYICDLPGSWPYSFYVVGIAGLMLSIPIFFCVAESPNVHPKISNAERDFILSNQESISFGKKPKRPWSSMLTSVPVWAFALGYFGHVWALSHFWTVQSTFLGTILHYPIAQNGIFTALPFSVEFLLNQIGAWLTLFFQKNNIASVNFLRKFWTIISALGFSSCLLGMYFAGCQRSLSIIFGIVSMAFIGLGTPGISVVATDMTPNFSGSLHAFVCTTAYLATFMVPVIVGYLTDNMQTIEQWNKVFSISIGIVTATKIIFVIFGSAETQPWNFIEEKTQLKAKKYIENSIKCNEGVKSEEITRF